ncbi:PRC-barrel domain-containing protein [Aquibium sp. A9E412]|uniref:PRC-barrel domain-containing protein n=1 Tax=Aquibium sp. A9E412 TaxID=2976767 RepID=UPI0025AF0BF8|nr:PRC-barrel domain-containing protein [Aquibium sp. A9E412]MDN2568148.1 PRC-barrel domain-containing protein [Aquibium sp. A9E412]
MLWTASALRHYGVQASDGEIGRVSDLLFDDRGWTIRWAVIEAGGWLESRKVLLPPREFARPDAAQSLFSVTVTRAQVKSSPRLDADEPVSRQHETDIYAYYGWQPYWAGTAYAPLAGVAATPVDQTAAAAEAARERQETGRGDPHLRSVGEVTGYYIHAADGDMGHVEDMLVEADGWAIRYVVVDTKNWWPGRKVLIAPQRIADINWAEGTIAVGLTREELRQAPEYDPDETADGRQDGRTQDYLVYI